MKILNLSIAVLLFIQLGCNNPNDATYEELFATKDSTSTQPVLKGKIVYSRTSWGKYDSFASSQISMINLKDFSKTSILSYGNSSVGQMAISSDSNTLVFIKGYYKYYLVSVAIDSVNAPEEILLSSDSVYFPNYPCRLKDQSIAGLYNIANSWNLLMKGKKVSVDRNIVAGRIAFTNDERRMLYSSQDDSFHISLYSYNIESSVSTIVITADASRPIVRILSPAISPDGTRILFQKQYNGASSDEVWTAGIDGSNPKKLATVGSFSAHPVWSPDGTQIAFISYDQIYIMNADGSNIKKLTNTYVDDILWIN